MIRPAHIFLVALLAAGAIFIPAAHAGFFSGWQDIYVSADDGKAYDFYANGEFLCSGKRCHYTNSNSNCKIEFVAKKGERIYGIEEFGDDYEWEQRSFVAKLLLDKREEGKPCTSTDATVKIDSRAHMHRYLPNIVNHTNWARPAQNKDFLVPKKTPHFSDWQKSPYGE